MASDSTTPTGPAGTAAAEQFTLAAVNETVAAAVPDREAIVFGDRRITFGDLAERTRRLASYLHSRGLGAHTERSELEAHESGQDHLALYLYNGNEYIEGMLGAYKARVAPFNVNYRYVAEELRYLFTDASARGVIYHAEFAPLLAEVLPELPGVEVLIQVDDDSGNDLLPGAVDYETAIAEGDPAGPPVDGVARRPLHRLHRRHHRHAQGRAVAPGRHLHERDGRQGGRHLDRGVVVGRDRPEGPRQHRVPAHAVARHSCTALRSGPGS